MTKTLVNVKYKCEFLFQFRLGKGFCFFWAYIMHVHQSSKLKKTAESAHQKFSLAKGDLLEKLDNQMISRGLGDEGCE